MEPITRNPELYIITALSRKSYLGADTERPTGYGMYRDSSVSSTFRLITLSVVTGGITTTDVPGLVFSLSSGELTGGVILKFSCNLLSS
jgi:hypothetical protein